MVFAGIGSRKTTNAVAALLPWTPPSAVVFGFGCVDANLQVREPLGEKVGKLRRRMSRYGGRRRKKPVYYGDRGHATFKRSTQDR